MGGCEMAKDEKFKLLTVMIDREAYGTLQEVSNLYSITVEEYATRCFRAGMSVEYSLHKGYKFLAYDPKGEYAGTLNFNTGWGGNE